MTLPLILLFAFALLGMAAWLIATRRSYPTMAQRQRNVDRALREMEERTR